MRGLGVAALGLLTGCLSDPPSVEVASTSGDGSSSGGSPSSTAGSSTGGGPSSTAGSSTSEGTSSSDASTSGDGTTSGAVEGLQVDLQGAPCVPEDEPVAHFVVGPTDGITCEIVGGPGNGAVPPGVELTSDCAVSDALREPIARFGTHAFMVEVTRGEDSALVPFCEYDQPPEAGEYVVVIIGDQLSWDGTVPAVPLEGFVGEFRVGEPLHFGTQEDPGVWITHTDLCDAAGCESWGARVEFSPSPFEEVPFSGLDGNGDQSVAHGMVHNLEISGEAVTSEFADRPIIVVLSLDYCLSDQPDGCNVDGGSTLGHDNWGTNIAIPIVMFPES